MPIWPAFAINTVFYAVILWLLFAGPLVVRRWRRIRRGLCPKCAYDLRGTPEGATARPECGAAAGPRRDDASRCCCGFTTADYDRVSPCNEKYAYACRVRDNGGDTAQPGNDRAFLPVIFEAKPEDDWMDETVWAKANPNLDVTGGPRGPPARMPAGPGAAGLWGGVQAVASQHPHQQPARVHPARTLGSLRGLVDPAALHGKACYGAFDLSGRQDVTALVLVFPPDKGDASCPYHILPYFWIPEEGMRERERVDRVPYSVWVKQAMVFTCPGNIIDEDAVEKHILELAERQFDIKQIAFDQWNAQWLGARLVNHGLEMVLSPKRSVT